MAKINTAPHVAGGWENSGHAGFFANFCSHAVWHRQRLLFWITFSKKAKKMRGTFFEKNDFLENCVYSLGKCYCFAYVFLILAFYGFGLLDFDI